MEVICQFRLAKFCLLSMVVSSSKAVEVSICCIWSSLILKQNSNSQDFLCLVGRTKILHSKSIFFSYFSTERAERCVEPSPDFHLHVTATLHKLALNVNYDGCLYLLNSSGLIIEKIWQKIGEECPSIKWRLILLKFSVVISSYLRIM